MTGPLRDLEVLVVDCQAGGATPAHGDLLEIGWALCGRDGIAGPVRAHWVTPRTARPVPRAIRDLTGWSEACLASSVPEADAWSALHDDLSRIGARPVPTVIHFARFELPFLRDLHERLGPADAFPFDAVCVHAVARRLFPDLPRRNIRALAGYLGHSTDLTRRARGHVEATAFIWRALVLRLEEDGVRTWRDLAAFVDEAPPTSRRAARTYPLAPERRRALPDRPGVYRFVRKSGDVLYVGKAASVKKRVASHFTAKVRATERALEMLTQVHDVDVTETGSVLEAALLETDEIKRIDPPYNVQLRAADRRAWFASRDMQRAAPAPDAAHPVGPLPSERALASIGAIAALAGGAEPSPGARAAAVGVPLAFGPDAAVFADGFRLFAEEHLAGGAGVLAASLALFRLRGRAEVDDGDDDAPPDAWDVARVKRRLERGLVHQGLLVRRARFLCLLADADVAFRERGMDRARVLVVAEGRVVDRGDIDDVAGLASRPARRMPPLAARKACFDATVYDRLRVLATELRRVHDEEGELAVRAGRRLLDRDRLARILGCL
jgi:DNA polymerase-3 subunit epsilon